MGMTDGHCVSSASFLLMALRRRPAGPDVLMLRISD